VRILLFSQYFSPEIGATQTRLYTFASGLAARGHDIEVICEVPNHPQGVVRPGFGRRLVDTRRLDGFRVRYIWVRVNPEKTRRTRLAFYGSYAAMAVLLGAAVRRPDVIFASSPPLPVAIAAAAAAARHRVPWVMDVRDLWPAAAVAMGEMAEGQALHAAEAIERRLYASATAITTVTEPFRQSIARTLDRPEKVVVLPNGTSQFWLARNVEPDRDALALPADRFVWTFAGNIGAAQGLEAAVDAAKLLDDRFQLLVLGDGPARGALIERARDAPAGAIEFRDQVDAETARRYLRSSDALLVSLAAHSAFASFVPSKLYDCCAVGRPVIVAAAGESHRIVAQEGAALPVPPGDPRAQAEAVRRLAEDPELRDRLARAGPIFAEKHLRDGQVPALEALMASVQNGSGAR
jgi:glycosyltransferase involved in cell wall biosynthesis